jgi:hypothetical protein
VTTGAKFGLPRTEGLMNAGEVGMCSEAACGRLVEALVDGNGVWITRPGSR